MEMNPFSFDFQKVFEADDYLYFYNFSNKRTEMEIQFLEKELNLRTEHKIIDIGCGHGRHSNVLAAKGYCVTGIDNSDQFLKIAKEEAETKKSYDKLLKKDMRVLDLQTRFDVALMMFTVFGYFNDEENERVISNISTLLNPGGLLCFDLMNRDNFVKSIKPVMVFEKNDDFMIDRVSFDIKSDLMINQRVVIRDGIVKRKPYVMSLYSYNEIVALLTKYGFQITKIFENWESANFTNESIRMVLVCEKNQ